MSTDEKERILLGDDESEVRNYLEVALRSHGYEVESATNGAEVLNVLRRGGHYSAVLLDIMMPARNGFETLREIRQFDPDLPILMLSGMFEPQNVVQAMKIGATDFLPKPISQDKLAAAVALAIKSAPNRRHERSPNSARMFLGQSALMVEVGNLLPKIAPSDVPVLINGETGTGKEVLARQLHALSLGASKPFIKLNCAAVPAELAESELFGHERGAFTSAIQKKPGIFELADGGTVFLDEIGDMDIRLQAKLLQVLQDREFRRVGGKETVRVDVRIIAATHRNLLEAIGQKLFREDLYYRLDGFSLYVPALRDRKQDIVPLAEFLIGKHASKTHPAIELTPSLRATMEQYYWPGNVRELESIIKRLLVLRDPAFMDEELINRSRRCMPAKSAEVTTEVERKNQIVADPGFAMEHAAKARNQAETKAVLEALKTTRWNRKQAAVLLNLDYKALLYKMKKLEIDEQPAA